MFDTIKIRLRHEKRHKEGDNFACQECDRKFTNEKNLAHHLKHHHNTAEKPEIKADEIAEEPKPKKPRKKKELIRPECPIQTDSDEDYYDD